MDPKNDITSTEAELESFRQRWREEVSARAKGKASVASAAPVKIAASSGSKSHAPKGTAPDATSHSHARQRSADVTEENSPYVHQDLGDKLHGRRLDETSAQTAAIASASKEPKTALDHYEKAVEREAQGSLGDSVRLYRKAFKVSRSCEERHSHMLISHSLMTVCMRNTRRSTFRLHFSTTGKNLKHRSPVLQQKMQHQQRSPIRRIPTLPMHQ